MIEATVKVKNRTFSVSSHDSFAQFEHDPLITYSLKRLIALYLSNVSDDKSSDYFDDILDEMAHEPSYQVNRAIDRMKVNYWSLYQLNQSF
ncbi:hypothetical protein [Bacillus alkalicellulosilyticus]|uniref:hypothetical protein n=1 Tax=Alkalihalobacterium alkalicellulosilyticum TaxID=1912214 RepID=UPI000998DFB3|nr:hypothetical protein [Bacillus alkalicellulosilyticus]